MTDTPLIRAAKALARDDAGSAGDWHDYVEGARAVLEAVREPSEGMLGGEAMDAYEGRFERPDTAEQHMVWIWQGMLNAALSE